MSASISTITRSPTPRCGARSPCSPIPTRCASSTAPQILACHRRSYDKGAQIEDAAHIRALVAQKARRPPPPRHRPPRTGGAGEPDPASCAPPSAATISAPSPPRCCGCSIATAPPSCEAAILEALARGVPHPNAVRLALERRREQRRQPPPVAVDLPAHVQARDAPVHAASARSLRPAQGADR